MNDRSKTSWGEPGAPRPGLPSSSSTPPAPVARTCATWTFQRGLWCKHRSDNSGHPLVTASYVSQAPLATARIALVRGLWDTNPVYRYLWPTSPIPVRLIYLVGIISHC